MQKRECASGSDVVPKPYYARGMSSGTVVAMESISNFGSN